MGFWGPSLPPHISKEEWKKIRSELYGQSLNSQKLDEIEETFRGDMEESREIDQGIDAQEIAQGLQWLRENIDKSPLRHHLNASDIDKLEQALKKRL